MAKIKAGWGVECGNDFTRLVVDTDFEVAPQSQQRGRGVVGWIKGDKGHRLQFMRADRVFVNVDRRSIIED